MLRSNATQSGIKWTSYLNRSPREVWGGHSTHSKDSLKQNLFIKEWHGSSLSFGASSLLPWQDNAVGSSFLLGSQVTKLLTWYDPFRLLEKRQSLLGQEIPLLETSYELLVISLYKIANTFAFPPAHFARLDPRLMNLAFRKAGSIL